MELEFRIVWRRSVAVVYCRGRLIYGEDTRELGRALRHLLESSKQVVLQLAAVSQIDSGGVGELGAAYLAAHRRDAEISMASLSPRVSEVLRITGLEQLFQIHPSEEEAVEAFLLPAAMQKAG
ncbi:MAG TPA: STAS domain-containing protein [Terriglobales bacterium]|nr:STAS domain-containing protein [Terriglobales bacterium]